MNSLKSSPTTPKSYKIIWKGIGFIRPGAFGPLRTRKSYFCKKIVDFQFPNEFPEFAVKSVDFIEKRFYNSPKPLRNQSFIDTFCEQGPLVWISMPDSLNLVNLQFLTASMPKNALFASKCIFLAPGVIPFINVSIWDVFWRSKTGKVHFFDGKL